jgi:hypothetical protein
MCVPSPADSTCTARAAAASSGYRLTEPGRTADRAPTPRRLIIFFTCVQFPILLKNFKFWSIILQNETKHHANFLAKSYSFSILDFGLKRSKKKSQKTLTHPHEKFDILDETKHIHKNFGILHFIIPK